MRPYFIIDVTSRSWHDVFEDAKSICLNTANLAYDISSPEIGFDIISIILCDDDLISDLNYRYRRRKGATNVLSFGNNELCLGPRRGDIFISFERISQEAISGGYELAYYLRLMVAHGLLHLFGYDHFNERSAQDMFSLQEEILLSESSYD